MLPGIIYRRPLVPAKVQPINTFQELTCRRIAFHTAVKEYVDDSFAEKPTHSLEVLVGEQQELLRWMEKPEFKWDLLKYFREEGEKKLTVRACVKIQKHVIASTKIALLQSTDGMLPITMEEFLAQLFTDL
jgi:hypothetical protein